MEKLPSEIYYDMLREELKRSYAIATNARKQGFDPTDEVEVKIAKDVAARVEGIVGPPGVEEVIRALEKNGMNREDIAFEVARKIAGGELIKGNKEILIEQAVRSALGIITEGVLVAPTEGIAKVKIKQNPDGSDYVAVYYAGPIRSAGGTAAAMSLMFADVARRVCGVGDYRATETQTMRYLEEVGLYESRVAHLQYMPPEEHMKIITSSCPVCIDGEPSEEIEVSTYRGVSGVETDRVRGGVPLVLCEGVAAKAAKLNKYSKKLKLGWDFLEKVIKVKTKQDKIEVKADNTYLEGLVAGRPVFSHPSIAGGFRLRYGRSETNSLMGKNIHPATMILLDNFLAFGTQMKIERPGKGCVVASHNNIEPPVVKLKNGRVTKVRTVEEAHALKRDVASVLFLGDMLSTYGDFLKSNHPLIPSGYCVEWWEAEIESKNLTPPQTKDAKSLFEFSKTHNVPVHPDYTYPWHDLDAKKIKDLAEWLAQAVIESDGKKITQMKLPLPGAKAALEDLLIEHHIVDNHAIISSDDAYSLLSSIGADFQFSNNSKIDISAFLNHWSDQIKPLDLVNKFAHIKAKAPTYIGARMGRPEKAKERKMDGSPHVLFPTGSFKNRSVTKHYRLLRSQENEHTLLLEIARYRCHKCNRICFTRRCDVCSGQAHAELVCQKCGRSVTTEMHCDFKTLSYDKRPVDVVALYEAVGSKLGFTPDEVKGIKGLSNPTKVAERLEKGFLRAKHDVYVFRDGTCRFDATDVPLTHFVPRQVGLSLKKAKELGYTKDYRGNPIMSDEQIIPLKHQDIVLAENGVQYLLKVANFIDDMLINLYGLRPFYSIKNREDLIGHLCVGLSPHTSAGALCRIIGFTRANVGYGHPYFHTAKRRNCFSGKEKLMLFDDVSKSMRLVTLSELVESNLSGDIQSDDFGTKYKRIPGLKTFAFNKKTKKYELSEITHVSKHLSPKKLVRLTTKSGRTITTTSDHTFPDRVGNKIMAKDAVEILTAYNVEFDHSSSARNFNFIDVADEQVAMLRTDNSVFNQPMKDIAVAENISYKSLTNYSYRKSYPLALVRKYAPDVISLEKYRISNKNDRVSHNPSIVMGEKFLSLLGMYVAEGFIKNAQNRTHQVSITSTKPSMRSWLVQMIREVFGITPSVSNNHVTICSSFVLKLFETINVGKNAKNKRVPDYIYSSDANLRHAFLRGYFTGDGSCSLSSTLEVNLTSVNKDLIDGVSWLLNLSGIMHSISSKERKIDSKIILDFYGKPKEMTEHKIRIYGLNAAHFIRKIGFIGAKNQKALSLLSKWEVTSRKQRSLFVGDSFVDPVIKKEIIDSDSEYVYNLTVDEHHNLICSGVTAFQCDADEDCIMLLMDALINFSRKFLSEMRGGTMDAPLVLSLEINPKEVDDESHSIEYVTKYPLEFYLAAEKITAPSDVKLRTVKDVLGTEEQYELPLTHPGGSIDSGNIRTAYVELESIPDKINIQFSLQEKIKAVDSKDAAERLILSHFIPDLYGNLRSFSRQTFRCVSCNTIARRPPLSGKCGRCGGNLLLTINKGGIQKYLSISSDIVKRYGLPLYLKQRLELLEKEIKSIFDDDKIKQLGLSDFL